MKTFKFIPESSHYKTYPKWVMDVMELSHDGVMVGNLYDNGKVATVLIGDTICQEKGCTKIVNEVLSFDLEY